jgi:DNA-binding SARP family transcriptional activator
MLRLTTFSTVDLADGGGEEFQALLKQPKRLGLLVYLAVEGPRSLHRRDSLLPIFWPELDEQRARHALSQALHVLRAAVGNGLIVTRGDEEVGIDPEALWCDATEFEALVGEGKFEEGLELLRGEFLPGFHLSDAPQFMEWVDAQRGNFRRKASLAAKGLCDQEKDRGRLEAAVSWARRGMEISPHDEAWLRRLV